MVCPLLHRSKYIGDDMGFVISKLAAISRLSCLILSIMRIFLVGSDKALKVILRFIFETSIQNTGVYTYLFCSLKQNE